MRHYGIADEFVYGPACFFHALNHTGKVVVKPENNFIRCLVTECFCKIFRKGGKSADVRKKDCCMFWEAARFYFTSHGLNGNFPVGKPAENMQRTRHFLKTVS